MILTAVAGLLLLSACLAVPVTPTATPAAAPSASPSQEASPTAVPTDGTPVPTATPAAAPSASPTDIPTATPTSSPLGYVEVEDGDWLVRDIIPQLRREFDLSVAEVRAVLASDVPSPLIDPRVVDFRRMEGIVPPGIYRVEPGDRLKDLVVAWIRAAEKRYDGIVAASASANGLSAFDRLKLASMVEAECLADNYYSEVATVFLNRLGSGMKLMSCVTAEYALGFQRPYLTTTDRKVVDVYNTYVAAALPRGPICVVDDGSLAAAVAVRQSKPIVYFFYDYILDDMYFFEDYKVFHAAALEARTRYVANSDIPMDAMVDKQELFGKGPVTRLTYPK